MRYISLSPPPFSLFSSSRLLLLPLNKTDGWKSGDEQSLFQASYPSPLSHSFPRLTYLLLRFQLENPHSLPPLHRPLSNSSLEAAPPLHSTPSSGGLSCFLRPEKGPPPTLSPRHSGRRKAQTFFHQGFFFGESHGSIPPDQTSPWPLPTFSVFFSRAPAAGMGAISGPSSG